MKASARTAGECFLLCVFVLVNGCGAVQPADLVIMGGTIHTMNPLQPRAEAVAVVGDRIVLVGTRAETSTMVGSETQVVELDGETMLPGLVDAHAHLMGLGRYLEEVQLVGTASAEEVRQLVLAKQSELLPGEWILGRGWDQNDWDKKTFPAWDDLDGTEANPVFLRRIDGHAAWLNETALRLLEITRDAPDPPGGRILRDTDGKPTGVLIDRAKDIAFDKIPEPSREARVRRLKRAIRECQRWGLTGVHDAQTTREELEILRSMERDGDLAFRIYAILDGDDSTFVMSEIQRGPVGDGRTYVTTRAIKLYADGALGSRGAALLEPYSDEPTHRGLKRSSPESLRKWARLGLENGFQMCAHAIGDAGNRDVIDAYEDVIPRFPSVDHRFRIEHAQVLAVEDIARMARLGVIASIQPTHATSDMYWAEDRIGSMRIKGAYAWRRLIDAGVTVACGSDFPVEGVNPLWGVYAAVTRQDHDGWPDGGWYPEERMTIAEAVKGFTINAAFARFAEQASGTIEESKLADFTILDRDIFAVSARDILATRVVHTVVGGRFVYSSTQGSDNEKRGTR